MMSLASASGESIGLITSILLLLVLARVFGEVMNRMGQAAVVGEILAGVVLGPAVLSIVNPSAQLEGIAELSVFLILLSAGLEMDFKEVMQAFIGKAAILAAVSFIIPMAAGMGLGIAFGLGAIGSVVLALVIAITALPVIARILGNFDLLDTKLSQYAIATAIFNDITALFCLGILLGVGTSLTGANFETLLGVISRTSAKFGLFALIVTTLYLGLALAGTKTGLVPNFLSNVMKVFGKEALFGLAILFVLVIGSLSEFLSSHFVIGVFFGGLLISKDVMGPRLFRHLDDTLNSITAGFLAPIFFAYIGLSFSWVPFQSFYGILFTVSVITVSIAAKILSARLGGRWARLPASQAMGVGIVLNSRGTMDLVVADIALGQNLISQEVFSTLVLLGIFSTMATPIMFKKMVFPFLDIEPSVGGAGSIDINAAAPTLPKDTTSDGDIPSSS